VNATSAGSVSRYGGKNTGLRSRKKKKWRKTRGTTGSDDQTATRKRKEIAARTKNAVRLKRKPPKRVKSDRALTTPYERKSR